MKTFSLKSLQNDRYVHTVPDEDVDRTGYENVKAAPGKVVVQMFPEREKVGSIYLPDEFATKTRPDVGTVVSAGDCVPLETGQTVVVRYGHGKRVKGFCCEGFKAKETMVFCGRAGGALVDDPFYGDPAHYARDVRWDESIVAVIEDGEFVPKGRNILIELTKVEKVGSLHLSETRYECDAKILALGPDAFYKDTGQGRIKWSEAEVGDYVVFDDGSVKTNPALTSLGEGLALILDEGVLAIH